jgi:hypothetical protein
LRRRQCREGYRRVKTWGQDGDEEQWGRGEAASRRNMGRSYKMAGKSRT